MKFDITNEEEGLRVDAFLAKKYQLSRTFVQRKINESQVTINEKAAKNSHKIKSGESIELHHDFFEEPEFDIAQIQPYNTPLDICYEDKDIIIINKQAGLVVHPGAGNRNNTLVNALVYHFGEQNLSQIDCTRLGIVHRLDKDTSGLMIVAKNNQAHEFLSNNLKNREGFTRKYLAICYGFPLPASGEIERFMKKGSFEEGKMKICKEGDKGAKFSKTHYEIKEVLENGLLSIVECKLSTGRTHQIRLHMQDIGHGIIGDQTYKHTGKRHNFTEQIKATIHQANRQLLHAYYIEFIHPTSKKILKFQAKIPEDMQKFLKNVNSTCKL